MAVLHPERVAGSIAKTENGCASGDFDRMRNEGEAAVPGIIFGTGYFDLFSGSKSNSFLREIPAGSDNHMVCLRVGIYPENRRSALVDADIRYDTPDRNLGVFIISRDRVVLFSRSRKAEADKSDGNRESDMFEQVHCSPPDTSQRLL